MLTNIGREHNSCGFLSANYHELRMSECVTNVHTVIKPLEDAWCLFMGQTKSTKKKTDHTWNLIGIFNGKNASHN